MHWERGPPGLRERERMLPEWAAFVILEFFLFSTHFWLGLEAGGYYWPPTPFTPQDTIASEQTARYCKAEVSSHGKAARCLWRTM